MFVCCGCFCGERGGFGAPHCRTARVSAALLHSVVFLFLVALLHDGTGRHCSGHCQGRLLTLVRWTPPFAQPPPFCAPPPPRVRDNGHQVTPPPPLHHPLHPKSKPAQNEGAGCGQVSPPLLLILGSLWVVGGPVFWCRSAQCFRQSQLSADVRPALCAPLCIHPPSCVSQPNGPTLRSIAAMSTAPSAPPEVPQTTSATPTTSQELPDIGFQEKFAAAYAHAQEERHLHADQVLANIHQSLEDDATRRWSRDVQESGRCHGGSIRSPGAHCAIFFFPFPTRACFCPPPQHQNICPQEHRADVATSDFVPFYWGPMGRRGLCSQSAHLWAPEKVGVM